jgi:hypothetical protein
MGDHIEGNEGRETMDWQSAEHVTKTVYYSVSALGIVIGGSWAYFRFFRFRMSRPRLEFSFDWRQPSAEKFRSVTILTVKLSNKGNTKVSLRKGNRHQCFLKYGFVAAEGETRGLSALGPLPEDLQHLGSIFAAHKWVEPGETIDDVKLFLINEPDALAIQFEVRLYGAQKWAAVAAFPLASEDENANLRTKQPVAFASVTEDEQDDYTQKEELEQLLGNLIIDTEKLLNSRPNSHEKSKIEPCFSG